MRFSENLARLLAFHGRTQKDVADSIGVNQASVSRWLDGSSMPRRQVLFQLADYFGVDVGALVEGTPSPRIKEASQTRKGNDMSKRLREEARQLRASAESLEKIADSLESG